MLASKVFLTNFRIAFTATTESSLIEIYFQLEPASLALASGSFTYMDPHNQMVVLPVISMNTPIRLQSINKGFFYDATLKLCLTDETIIFQKFGFTFISWLQEISIAFIPNIAHKNFKGSIRIQPTSADLSSLKRFTIHSKLIDANQPRFLDPAEAEVFFCNLTPGIQGFLTINCMDQTGKINDCQFLLFIPHLSFQETTVDSLTQTAYEKLINADTIQENFYMLTTKNIAAHQTEWLLHEPETASLQNSKALTAKYVTSEDAYKYIHQYHIKQHQNYLDYTKIRQLGFDASKTTEATWFKILEGNQFLKHTSKLKQHCETNSETLLVNASLIHYHYERRLSTFSGAVFKHTAIHAQITSVNEYSSFNTLIESTPQCCEIIEYTVEDYITQNFNFNLFTFGAKDFNNSGLMVVQCQLFELTDINDQT